MTRTIVFDPLLPWPLIAAIAVLAAIFVALSLWRGLRGWWLRGLAALALLAGIANPAIYSEERDMLPDIVIAVVDASASQRIADRPAQTEAALEALRAQIAARGNTELRVIEVADAEDNGGTLAMTALSQALAEEPQGRIAGIVMLTDGRIHDAERAPASLPAPMHVLLSGQEDDWDRRLTVVGAPAFGIIGEPVNLTLRVEDQGAAPTEPGDLVPLTIAVDGGAPMSFEVPLGQEMELPVTLQHGGMNVLQFSTPGAEGELTGRNNASVLQINGVRDRLRVLLVSGEPYAGERTWRNLLKSDASVDLVHFTILRPPEKQDGVPADELSLIAFPTRELFIDKIDEFDLIIFDRYSRQGILPSEYFANIGRYVQGGGAVLVTAGPEYAGAESLYRSPLGMVLPGAPTARVIGEPFVPRMTELGARHPVTEGLAEAYGTEGTDVPGWGEWFRQVQVQPGPGATTAMEGAEGEPLLLLNRVGEGRVALLASDQIWLWGRGYQGGGPQLELLRRLAHWMMKEPELEEEALWAEPRGQTMRIVRRTLAGEVGRVTVTGPDGEAVDLPLEEVSPGRFEVLYEAPETGLYRLEEGDQSAVIALGPAAPREFEQTIAGAAPLEAAVEGTRGGILRMADGAPSLRDVRPGRPASGRGWIGLTPREAYRAADVTVLPLLPAWALLLVAGLLVLGGWLREGRR
ncbi:hypothetical protein [Pseudoroseicyclus aestuarii]|uniref:Glutamine amidotransferase n=1 Tax=Pseudoroseicyclus aestuarii TaxID=1795041 RepID=A0A318T633_9RHOB|nr:hypothetical protein [Pseudoroseicyclus aestuarii]PYE83838.1 hypothetical protein DFP88_103199 [Pseudoroseicyclus aestuarii]